MCIKFFRSLITGIYSLTLPSSSRLRQILLDKKKRLPNINYTKILQPNHQNLRRIRTSFPPSWFIGNSLSANHQDERISIFKEYSSGPSDGPHQPIPTLYNFCFLSNRQPFLHQIILLDTCQKMVSTHAPQFRSNLFCSEINSNHNCQRSKKYLLSKKMIC